MLFCVHRGYIIRVYRPVFSSSKDDAVLHGDPGLASRYPSSVRYQHPPKCPPHTSAARYLEAKFEIVARAFRSTLSPRRSSSNCGNILLCSDLKSKPVQVWQSLARWRSFSLAVSASDRLVQTGVRRRRRRRPAADVGRPFNGPPAVPAVPVVAHDRHT